MVCLLSLLFGLVWCLFDVDDDDGDRIVFYWQLLYGISRRKCSGSDEVDDDDDEAAVSLKGCYIHSTYEY